MSENVCGEPCPRHAGARCIVARLPPSLRDVPPSLRDVRRAIPLADADLPHAHLHVYNLRGYAGMVIHSWVEGYAYGHGGRIRTCTREEAERLVKMGVER